MSVDEEGTSYDWATEWHFPDGHVERMSANSAGKSAQKLARKRATQQMNGATSARVVYRVRTVGPWQTEAEVPHA